MSMISFPVCNQCGFSHPPIPVGSKCPMAKDKGPSGQEIDFNILFAPLKDILISQIQNKDIKDIKKFFGNIIIEITKSVEGYKED